MRVVFPMAGWMIVAGSFAIFVFSSELATTKSQNSGIQDSALVGKGGAHGIHLEDASVTAAHSPDLTACAESILRPVSFSLPLRGAAMGTTGTAQRERNRGQAQCMQRLTITSTPCGATIYVDNIRAGETPITFPMPPGRYTVVLFAPGHQPFAERILISNAPVQVTANLSPLP